MNNDYRIGAASYCGSCSHASSRHTRGGMSERSHYCKGNPATGDPCDCTRTKECIVRGASAGPALARKDVETARGTHRHGRSA